MTTGQVRPARQYDYWRDAVNGTHHAWDMPARRRTAFRGHVRRRALGGAELLACETDPCSGRRGRSELGRTSRAATGVLVILAGREKLSLPDGDSLLHAGSFTLWDTTRPLRFDVPERLVKLTLMLPAELVEPTLPALDPCLGRVFDGTSGCGALLVAQLRALAALPSPLGGNAAEVALRSTLDLLSAAVAALPRDRAPSEHRMVARIQGEVCARLDDPALSVAGIARTLGISRRQVDRVFARTGMPLGRYIWAERLRRCRRDLILDGGARISEVAFRWGFSDPAHFSRAFRRSFGVSPRDYRARRRGAG